MKPVAARRPDSSVSTGDGSPFPVQAKLLNLKAMQTSVFFNLLSVLAISRDSPEPGPTGLIYRWHWRKRLPERHGQVFRVVCRGALNSCLVEFEDRFRAVTSRNALRRRGEVPVSSQYARVRGFGGEA